MIVSVLMIAVLALANNRPQVVDLQPVFDGYNADGCVSISSTLAKDIQRNAAQYYLLAKDGNYPERAARIQPHK